jgi:protein-S-isoprenylcysteine O-methyltransferase Ste14
MAAKYYNSIPDIALIGSIIVALFLNAIAPIATLISFPTTLVGWAMLIAAFSLAISILSSLRSQRSSTDAGDTPSVLIVTKFYSHSRNPYYLSCLGFTIGATIAMGSLAAFVAPILYFATIQTIIIPLEERILQIKFGESYAQYKQTVRRWL